MIFSIDQLGWPNYHNMALSAVCFKRWTCIYLSSSIPQSPGLWSKPVCLCVCTWKHHILLSQFLEKLLSLFAASKQFSTTFQGRLMETLVFQPSETSPAGCTFTWKCGCDLMKSDNQSINQSIPHQQDYFSLNPRKDEKSTLSCPG